MGVLIGQKITNMLQGINWDEVYSNASKVSISFATFLMVWQMELTGM